MKRICVAMDRGSILAISRKVKEIAMTKSIPEGDPYCEIAIELE